MILPSGFELPPLLYLTVLVGGAVLITAVLWSLGPLIDQRTVVGLAPWMALGGALHALNQPPIELYDAALAPLFGSPAVYLTTFNLVGAIWVVVALVETRRGAQSRAAMHMGLIGLGVLTVVLVLSAITALRSDQLALIWPTASVFGGLVVGGLSLGAIAFWRTPIIIRARYAAPVVLFAHAFDGVSTAIGKDVIGVAERSPIPRLIMDLAGSLPTAETIGSGWLFIFVKVVVAMVVVVSMDEYLSEEPVEASLVLSAIAAVGLGPATNNFVLFLFTPV